MELTIEFVKYFALSLFYASPLILVFALIIIFLGQRIGRIEGWSRGDALYFSLITATTVGYGDFRPAMNRSKVFAVAIAFIGLLQTGIVVGIGIHAAEYAFSKTVDVDETVIPQTPEQ